MSLPAFLVRAAPIALLAAMTAGCGPYGARGDKGLAPAPASMPYTGVYKQGPDNHNKLKTPAEQKQIEQDLLAGRKQRRGA